MDISKRTLFIIIVVGLAIILLIGGYLLWNNSKKSTSPSTLENTGDVVDKINESAAKGVLPSLSADPLENKPDINPVDKANPYKNIKTNPFQ